VWLAAQATYLAALNETNPINEIDSKANSDAGVESPAQEEEIDVAPKKAVRFAEGVPESLSPRPPVFASKDSIYWRGFQSIRQRCGTVDGFLHRNMRFDAVQSFRLGLVDMHLNCLMGKYELVRPERPAYKGPFSQAPRNSIITSVLAEKAQFSKLEKEQLVLAQLCQPMWAMDALRSLNGGKLLTSPVEKRATRTRKTPQSQDGQKPRVVRILDLGGHASCEWGWHAAQEFPHTKVYSVVNKTQVVNSAIKGPPNHRVVSVERLWELPFGNNKFDVITTRSLHALLKTDCPSGFDRDEYDLVLKECRRCLKPGGYLEFMVLDAEISRAGPYASASSVEFAFNLRTRGYDPIASKSFLSRLRQSGYVNIKRAWMFLPMGTEPIEPQPLRETPAPRVRSQIEGYEAVQGPIGSTEDIASITGILGGWLWEQWLVRLRAEMGHDRSKLLDGVGALFDEGRKNGAGWTCLSGWAMKPKPVNQMVQHRRTGSS
jgi:SAM-dependent methyltransferase